MFKYLILNFSFALLPANQRWWMRRGFGGSSQTSYLGVGTPLAPHATKASSNLSYQSGSASTKVGMLSSMACAWSSTAAPLKHLMHSLTVSPKRFPCRLGWGTSLLLGGFMQSILWMNWRMGNPTSALIAVRWSPSTWHWPGRSCRPGTMLGLWVPAVGQCSRQGFSPARTPTRRSGGLCAHQRGYWFFAMVSPLSNTLLRWTRGLHPLLSPSWNIFQSWSSSMWWNYTHLMADVWVSIQHMQNK